jgi:HD-like signal output (HDOD) protein
MPANLASMSSTHRENPTPLEAVLSRLHGSSGFPTLSSTISDINRVVASESHSTQQITQVILRDVSLTTKLLQVVNSATYSQFGGRIRTVSKAVLILGGELVRNVAMTLMMLEFSKGRPQEKSLQDELIGAFFAGVVSGALCRRLGIRNSEEAVICTMCQSLGRLVVIFFLYEESQKVRSLMQTGLPEEQAAERVLGISYRELGVGVARHWSFPDRLVEGMQSLAAREVVPPRTDVENLNIVANLANDLYITALRSSRADQAVALQALSKRYGAAIKLSDAELLEAIRQGLTEMAERSTTLNLPTQDSQALNVVRIWTGGGASGANAGQMDGGSGDDTLLRGVAALDAHENDTGEVANARQVLFAGIREVTETLTSDFELNDVLQMALETMYRGMGFSRTMMFIRDTQLSTMRARFGFGAEIERIIPQCSFPLVFGPDVFHVALEKRADVVIEDAQAANIIQRIPQWHRQAISAKSFLLLPVVLQNEVVGLIYADSDRAEGLKINAELLNLLRTLRSQVVLAFKHSGASGRR